MKKIYLLACMLFVIFFSTGCATNEIDVTIKNVQETEISFSVPDDTFSSDTIKELKNKEFTILKESDKTKVSTIVSNIKLKDDINKRFEDLLVVLKQNQPEIYNQIKDYPFKIESSFNGYSFGAVESVNINVNDLEDDFKININGQDVVSLNNGEPYSSIEITGKDLKDTAFISYNMLSIDELKVKIEPRSNYKSIDVFFRMSSVNPVLNDMPVENIVASGFIVESQSSSSLTLSKNYENSEMFNYVFNMDILNFFGLVGKVDVDYNVNLIKEINVNAAFAKSDIINNVQIELTIPKSGTDSISGVKDTNFSWNLDKNFKADIKSTVPNYSTIIIAFISIIGTVFVIMGLSIIKKRGIHIKYK